MVWYFVFVMVLGFILEFINLASKNEKLSVLLEPARQSGEWLPLAAFIASLFAITNLREIDFVIILGIAILHQILTYILKPNIGKESILRLILPAWIVLLAHTIVPSNLTIGISLACVAVGQAVLVFSNIIKKKGYEQHRQETECGWLIVIMVCFIVASIYLGDRNITMTWTWVSVALALDSAILLVTRHLLKQDVWALGLLATGIALPIAITSALGVSANNAMTIYATSYLIEMLGLEALFWKNAEKTNDIFTMLSVFILGTASLIAGWNQQSSPIIFLIMAACFLARGIRSRNDTLKEIAVYCAAVGIYRMFNIFNTDLNLNSRIKTEILVAGHVALAGLITSSILFERKNHNKIHTRLLIGCIVVLLSVGIVALNGLSWAMYLFLIETVIILLSGIFIKDKSLRYAGAVGAILAVFWFTKDLSFVWPTLLGLGIISTVVIILIKNNKK
ncbi:hypothetical protein IJ076_01960 [Candidatus Saccharibacteria bacterium]|nr:hypothetical protein [Candidatus Saccharibacteria bacterium]